jgi:hypothetical protein
VLAEAISEHQTLVKRTPSQRESAGFCFLPLREMLSENRVEAGSMAEAKKKHTHEI